MPRFGGDRVLLRLERVTKKYSSCGRVVPALTAAELHIYSGQAVLVYGPSGSGKTTLLALVGGLLRPTSGTVYLDDQDLYALPDRHLSRIRGMRFCFVFQQFQLLPGLSVAENISLPLLPRGLPARVMTRRIEDVLAMVGLGGLAGARAAFLSGGEQQRVALARALAGGGDVVIADEPTSSLDQEASRMVLSLFARLKAEGKTLLATSHDPELFRSSLWERRILVERGCLKEMSG